MISFKDWHEVYAPIYGTLADRSLYEAHLDLDGSTDPEVYRQTIPAAARKALGEFYTPDWLVDFALDRAGYVGGRLFDPSCGAGAFLARAGEHATGWDINPQAVRMARARCPAAHIEVKDAFVQGSAQFDFIAGNPPWVNWRHLDVSYRERIAPLWKEYGLFTQTGLKARLGGAMDDLSALMTYACADRYLSTGGRLAFLLPAPLFQSAGGGAGFRRFALPGGQFLRVVRIDEIGCSQPFEGAATRPVLAVFEKSRTATVYPVLYTRGGEELEARPIAADPASPWSILPKDLAASFDVLRGESHYKARIGAHTGGAAGVYWVDVLEDRGATLLIRNRSKSGRNSYAEVTAEVEREFVHPLARGRDLMHGGVNPSGHVIVPHAGDGRAVNEDRMRREFPLTFAYFENFRAPMLTRAHYRHHFAAAGMPYWSMYNVGPYTFAPHRVAWREQCSTFQCALLPAGVIADAKLITVECESHGEALRLTEFLNSESVRTFVESYVLKTQISTHVFRYLRVPHFAAAGGNGDQCVSNGHESAK